MMLGAKESSVEFPTEITVTMTHAVLLFTFKGNKYILWGENSIQIVLPSFGKRLYTKRKIFFLTFQNGLGAQKSKQEVTKYVKNSAK